MYAIETKYADGWSREVGDPTENCFKTIAEAEAAIAALRECGDDWEQAQYRVVKRDADI